ncbi:MAG TPA: hypothetical protein VES00_09420 [Burkholderiaceae bacterium]|jgi:hypothetical protein|nr:hypothetical protein [Burkholderiaceae bacterium]
MDEQRRTRGSTAHGIQAVPPHAPCQGQPRHDKLGRGPVIVAHLASLLSVGLLVVGLTTGAIALARRYIDTGPAPDLAVTARDDGASTSTAAKETGAESSR